MMNPLSYCFALLLIVTGIPASISASPITLSFGTDPITISFGTDAFDGNPNDNLFQLKNGSLYLRDPDFVPNIGPNNEVAIKPIDVNAPVVTEATFDVIIGGNTVSVTGVRLTNIEIKAQNNLAGFTITSSETKAFANPLKFAGVLLGNNTIHYPVVADHQTSITNTGLVDGMNIGSVTQTNTVHNGAGDFTLVNVNVSAGQQINLGAGNHRIDSQLALNMEQGSILILRDSGDAGVAPVPEPSTLALVGIGTLIFWRFFRSSQRKRLED